MNVPCALDASRSVSVAGLGTTVLVSTAMTSTSVPVTGLVWEPISAAARPAGTAAHAH